MWVGGAGGWKEGGGEGRGARDGRGRGTHRQGISCCPAGRRGVELGRSVSGAVVCGDEAEKESLVAALGRKERESERVA